MKPNTSVTTSNPVRISTGTLASSDFLTTQELMDLLRIKHRQTIYGLIEAGMPVLQAGRNFRFIKHEVINFLKHRTRNKLPSLGR